MTEMELYSGCLSKERRAQNLLYEKYKPTLLKTIIKLTRNIEDAEDCLQDAFTRIFNKIDTFENKGSFEGWMRTVARNVALKKYVTLRAKNEFLNDTSIYEERSSSIPDPHSVLEHKNILSKLKKVPEKMSRVFYMYEIEGYEHEEIAELMNIKSSTSRSQLMKAKLKLQKIVE